MQSANENLGSRLQNFEFLLQRRSLETPTVESYLKIITGIEVEFLTDQKSRTHEPVAEIEGVHAQTLRYIDRGIFRALSY